MEFTLRKITETQFKDFVWIDFQSPTKEDLVAIAEKYSLDSVTVKTCLESGHLPKLECYTDYTFVNLRAYSALPHQNITTVQELSNKVAFFYNDKFLITIHRVEFLFLNELVHASKDLKSVGLMTMIFLNIIKTFKAPAEWQSQQLDKIENIIFLQDLSNISLENLYYQKTETRITKKLLILTQEVLHQIQIVKKDKSELRYVQDLLSKLILEYDEASEDAHNLMHTYMSVSAQKNNDTMKLLTIVSMFFLPLTFIVGLYGMNFDFMPELHWKYGYPVTLAVMLLMCGLIFYAFKKRKVI